MKESKEIEQYDDEHGKPFDLEFTCAIMEAFNDQETKKLREENANYKAMNKTLRDQVKQWEKVPNLKELREENERLKSKFESMELGCGFWTDLEESEKRIKELEDENRSLHKEIGEVRELNELIEEKSSELREDIKAFMDRVDETNSAKNDMINPTTYDLAIFNYSSGLLYELESILTKDTKNK
ncbi:hypothetical protein [Ekhidna sp.]